MTIDNVHVLGSAPCTVEVVLRWLLQHRGDLKGVAVVAFDNQKGARVWLSEELNTAETALSGAMLTERALYDAESGVPR